MQLATSAYEPPCGGPTWARPPHCCGLLSFVTLHHCFNLLFERLEVERGRLLHWREVYQRLCCRRDRLLHLNEAPELSSEEVIAVSECTIIGGFSADHGRPFERILPQVDNGRHVGRRLFSRPAIGLLEKLKLEVVDPN